MANELDPFRAGKLRANLLRVGLTRLAHGVKQTRFWVVWEVFTDASEFPAGQNDEG